ncbi:hypothetical protein BD560DRAFT_397631 [Blakeslea trispora]|nr:hypothetical protein BD560DRAFT_397631 [Blakeslea trispora]
MSQPIKVYLHPPSPTTNLICTLPSVKSLFPESMEEDESTTTFKGEQSPPRPSIQQLPSIRVTEDADSHLDTNHRRLSFSNKLDAIEPQLDSLSISTSPYQQSPIMSFSSPSSTTSSLVGSPLISPISDGPFLLPPPDANTLRRCRSVSNSSVASSPTQSPYTSFSFRSLSEPPTLNLPPPSAEDDDDEEDDEGSKGEKKKSRMEECHPVFGPKRKRGRPPNASRPEIQADSNFTFVKPTVWDVKQQKQTSFSQQESQSTSHQITHASNTPHFAESIILSEGINTFTATNMDMALNIPKKKRGRKPKKQLAGNSCFVWRDLTAPRGANKKQVSSKSKKSDTNITHRNTTMNSHCSQFNSLEDNMSIDSNKQ